MSVNIKYSKGKGTSQTDRQRYIAENDMHRLVSMANKRLRRLEKNNLQELKVYQNWLNYKGGVDFSVRGKTQQELRVEMKRLQMFLDADTSLVRNAKSMLKGLASSMGVKVKSYATIGAEMNVMLRLLGMVQELIKVREGGVAHISYHQIINQVQKYTDENEIILGEIGDNIYEIAERVAELMGLEEVDKVIDMFNNGSLW